VEEGGGDTNDREKTERESIMREREMVKGSYSGGRGSDGGGDRG